VEGGRLGNGADDLGAFSPGERQDDGDACAGRACLDRHRDLALDVQDVNHLVRGGRKQVCVAACGDQPFQDPRWLHVGDVGEAGD
jgi:hypothetical protein